MDPVTGSPLSTVIQAGIIEQGGLDSLEKPISHSGQQPEPGHSEEVPGEQVAYGLCPGPKGRA